MNDPKSPVTPAPVTPASKAQPEPQSAPASLSAMAGNDDDHKSRRKSRQGRRQGRRQGKRQGKRRRHWHLGFWMLVWLTLGAGFLWLASLSVSGRTVQFPDWAVERIETRLNTEMDNINVSVSGVEFGVSPAGFPQLSLIDMLLRDRSGLEIAQIHRVQGGARPTSLLLGRIAPTRLYLTGAQVTVRRRVNGEFDLSFGQGGGTSGDLASVLDGIDAVFANGPLSRAESIEADQLTITLEDARSGRLWQVTDGRLSLTQDDKIVDMTLAFDVFNQTEELAELVLGIRTDKSSSEASFGATFRNATAVDIAAQSPVMAFLSVLDAPISGALRSSINAQGQVSALAGTLELGAGALSPAKGAKPISFDRAKVYISYDPETERIDFTDYSVVSEFGQAQGEGYLYLRDMAKGWPTTLLGQFQLAQARVNAEPYFEAPINITKGAVDFRLRLNPFTLEIGQLVLDHQDALFHVDGEISAGADGWALALDAETAGLGRAQALGLWPLDLAVPTRKWVSEFVTNGELTDLNASFRLEAGAAPRLSVGASFHDADARIVKEMAPLTNASGYLSIIDQSFVLVAESGAITAPIGGDIDVSGTVFTIAHMPVKPTPANVDLQVAGTVGAVLSLLDAAPFNVLQKTAFGPDLAQGDMVAQGRLALMLRPKMQPEDAVYDVTATARNVRSDVLVPGRELRADQLEISATNTRLEITGLAHLGQASGRGTWFAGIGKGADGTSRLEAEITLDQAFLDEFNIGLPPNSLTGAGIGQLAVDFARAQPPAFTLRSDLNRLGIAIADLGWSKPRNRTGSLRVAGRLSDPATVDSIEFEAPDLQASGRVSLRADGGLHEAVFSRVRMGGWLDAPVTFTGRGPDLAAAITVSGGSADMRRAQFTGGSGADQQDAPIALTLDRLTITEGIALTTFRGQLNRRGGLNGTFSALVNGGPAIRGVVAAQENGSAIRITSTDAGGVLKAAEVFQTARGGDMTLVLAPLATEGTYDGTLEITATRMVGASALAELLSAISIVGLLEQLSEDGIAFSEVDARFRLTPTNVIIQKASAVGASLGVSLDGTYTLGSGVMDLSGVFSPLYILNGLGQIFTRRGEGLIGFTYTLQGTAADPKIAVNPLSLFTPAMFREIFRRPPPELSE